MIDRQELLRAISELSEAGYKTFDKDELLKRLVLIPILLPINQFGLLANILAVI